VGAFLAERYEAHVEDRPGVSKVIWDLAAVAWLLEPSWPWITSAFVPSPVLTEDMTWATGPRRHLICEVTHVQRDAIFADFFRRLMDHATRERLLD
jgi:purine nucleosidase